MAEEQQQKSEVQVIAETARDSAIAAKAAGFAASGNVGAAAVELLKSEQIRKAIIATVVVIAFFSTACSMLIGSAITGVVETVSTAWEESWNENYYEASMLSGGNAMYMYNEGLLYSLGKTAADTAKTLFNNEHDPEHKVDDRDATNQSISENTILTSEDYQTTLRSITEQEALNGPDGALTKRLELVKNRVHQRGQQIKEEGVIGYEADAIGLSIAEILVQFYENPILYAGVASYSESIDLSAFDLTDIQALKILAAYSIQHDCSLTDIDMYDLMDYCGWFDGAVTSMPHGYFGEESIYEWSSKTAIEEEIGGVVGMQPEPLAHHYLDAPNIPYWRGTYAPQWYYEEIAQINAHNKKILDDPKADRSQLFGITNEDEELDIENIEKLSTVNPCGIVDKIFSTAEAQLRVYRTEYMGADRELREAVSELGSDLITSTWNAVFGAINGTDDYGNAVFRSDNGTHGIHIYGGLTGSTKGSYSGNGESVTYTYYVVNQSTGAATHSSTCSHDGQTVTLTGLSSSTEYKIYERRTVTRRTLGGNTGQIGNATVDGDISVSTSSTTSLFGSFVTFSNPSEHQAYQIELNLMVMFSPTSIDDLCMRQMGLWRGSFASAEKARDGTEYYKGHVGEQLFARTWTDTYTSPDGNTVTLDFERQSDYQYEAYVDLIDAMGAMLDIDTSSLHSSSSSAGQDIVDVALEEYDIYTSNNLQGGARYWNMVKEAIGWSYDTTTGWCVAFVYCCAWKCDYIGEGKCFGPDWHFGVLGAYSSILAYGKGTGYETVDCGYKPVPGDLIFFGTVVGRGNMTHIGIVEYVDEDGQVHVVHGNGPGAKVCRSVYSSYQIGTQAGMDQSVVICAYLNPEYPASQNTDPIYTTISGNTAAYTTARYANFGSASIPIVGLGRWRTSQLQTVVSTLQEDYTDLYKEDLQFALDNNDIPAFIDCWNKIDTGKRHPFRRAQLTIFKDKFCDPVADRLYSETGFNWNGMRIRQELMYGLVSTTDQTEALIKVMTRLTQNIPSNISDAEFIEVMRTNDFCLNVVSHYSEELWPDEPRAAVVSWQNSLTRLLSALEDQQIVYGSLSDEYYITNAAATDPNYRGHAVPELTTDQIADIKNTLYGEFGSDLAGCILVAQSIRDNVDRGACTYDDFIEKCKYHGGYVEREPAVYETENVNKAFEYVFISGGSGIQHPVWCFYAQRPNSPLDDAMYQSMFRLTLKFLVQVKNVRFFAWINEPYKG